MTKVKSRTIKVGDKVRLKVARKVKRVGYPLCLDDIYELPEYREVEAKLVEALYGSSPHEYTFGIVAVTSRLGSKLSHALAYTMLGDMGFGGPERTVHFAELSPDYEGRVGQVVSKRHAMTGTYTRDSWSDPEEGYYSSNYLENAKRVTLLRVRFHGEKMWDSQSLPEILATDVEVEG